MASEDKSGLVFRIEKYMISDGLGIRTNIFLKGCPLRCKWCFNPEGINAKPEIIIFHKKCTLCGECIKICEKKAIQIRDGRPVIDRSLCDVCGKCVVACPTLALELCGKSMTVNEVMAEIRKDEIFYRRSGGGVTLTGGEVSAQADFARDLLIECKREFHTAIETCGFAPWDRLREIITHTDQVFFDVKHMDTKKHLAYTGVKNEPILANLTLASGLHAFITVRIPLIPGFNDSEKNIVETARFVKGLGNISKIEILPYVGFGQAKYEMLGLAFPTPGVTSPSPEALLKIEGLIKKVGLECSVVD